MYDNLHMSSLIAGKIYKIVSPNTDKIYIGSTTYPLHERMQRHISRYDRKKLCCTSKLIIEAGNATIELIEVFNCDNRKQLLQREGYYIRLYINICVNKVIPDRSPQEHYQDNRDDILEQKKQFYQSHKDQILKQVKQYQDTHKNEIAAQKKQYQITHKNEINARQRQNRRVKRQAAAHALAQNVQLLIPQVE